MLEENENNMNESNKGSNFKNSYCKLRNITNLQTNYRIKNKEAIRLIHNLNNLIKFVKICYSNCINQIVM